MPLLHCEFVIPATRRGALGFVAIGYPVLGYFIGHRYPQSPPFGLTPCPLSVFTFGLLLFTDSRVPKWILAIPFLYALGGILPVSIGVTEDLAMLLAGVVGTAMILYRDAKRLSVPEETF